MARVLVAVDGSELARYAAQRAMSLLGPDHEVTIARVVHPPTPMTSVPEVAMGTALSAGAELGEATTESLVVEAQSEVAATARALGVDATSRVVVGDPGPELCRLAGEGDFDVMVVGSHGSGVLKRILLGSVSHHTVHHAPCPVLVVRSAEHGGGI